MTPRLFEVQAKSRAGVRQETPAPLLYTRRGQLPDLPAALARRATPTGTTLVLELSVSDWHTLNANAKRLTSEVLGGLRNVPGNAGNGDGVGAGGLIGYADAVLFLAGRQAGSRETLCSAAGKSTRVRVEVDSTKGGVRPEEVARLHETLGTDYAITLTDGPMLCETDGTGGVVRRRAKRSAEVGREFLEAAMRIEGAGSVIGSVQGGLNMDVRREMVREVWRDGLKGLSVDGLYAGESPRQRAETVDGCVRAMEEARVDGLRVVTGGTGAPWEVVRMVRSGVDVVSASFPFDMARCGYATRLQTGEEVVNVRDRQWERCRRGLVQGCGCFVCTQFSVGYVRHLWEVREMMGTTLVVAHNLWDYLQWFAMMRDAIRAGHFERFVADTLPAESASLR